MSTFDKEPLRAERGDVRLRRSGAGGERGCRGRSPYRLVPGLPARVGEPPPGGRSVRLLAHRCAASDDIAAGRVLRFASPRRPGNSRCCRRRGSGPSRNGNRSRPGSNASCSRPTRKGTGSACWCASRPARATPRIRMRASKSCISSTASCGSTSASSSPATTTTVRLDAGDERVWSETGCTCVLVTSTKDTLR